MFDPFLSTKKRRLNFRIGEGGCYMNCLRNPRWFYYNRGESLRYQTRFSSSFGCFDASQLGCRDAGKMSTFLCFLFWVHLSACYFLIFTFYFFFCAVVWLSNWCVAICLVYFHSLLVVLVLVFCHTIKKEYVFNMSSWNGFLVKTKIKNEPWGYVVSSVLSTFCFAVLDYINPEPWTLNFKI